MDKLKRNEAAGFVYSVYEPVTSGQKWTHLPPQIGPTPPEKNKPPNVSIRTHLNA